MTLSSPLCAEILAAGLWIGAALYGETNPPATADEASAGTDRSSDREVNPDNVAGEGDALRSLDIVIAEHAIIWDGEVVTWEQVVNGLRDRRKQAGEPIHPNFHFTNKAMAAGREKKYKAAAFEVYKELFEPAGMSIGSISPRAGGRYDAIRTAADLVPRPEDVRTGVVRNRAGRPVWRATVFLMPEKALMPVMLRPGVSLRDPVVLRDRLDEVWTLTDKQGRFRIASSESGYRLAVFAPQGFALAPLPESDESAEITLSPRSEVEIASADKSQQMVSISVRHPDLPDSSPGFAMFEVGIGDERATISLPPGRVTVSRSFDVGEGTHVSVPAESFELKAGAKRAILLPAPDPDKIPKSR